MPGNFSGPRRKIRYINDLGVAIRLTTDADLVVDETGTGEGNLAGTIPRPIGFEPRGVYIQAFVPGQPGEGATPATPGRIARKFLVCNPGAELYTSDSPQTITIDGVLFTTTGRKGETQSFV